MSQGALTYDDYCQLNDDRRYELINGVIYLMSAPSRRHQEISGELFRQISNYLFGKQCKVFNAPFDVRLPLDGEESKGSRNVVQPDIAIICDKNKLDDAGCIGAPDLIAEILSPSTAIHDLIQKRRLYEKAGVAEYWIVDPVKRQVAVLRLNKDGRYDDELIVDMESPLSALFLPDMIIDMQSVFAE